ncbi:MAG: hypothetical protein OCD76_10120 [Reichenbachiella sp.]
MGNKINEATIMDYLFEEMSKEDSAKFELQLEEDNVLKKEVEEMKMSQLFLQSMNDKEVVIPSFVFNEPVQRQISFFESAPFRWVSTVAAGLIFILLSGYFSGFKFTQNELGLTIGFGDQLAVQQESQLTKNDVQSWMKEVLNDYDDNNELKLQQLVDQVDTKIENQKSFNRKEMNLLAKKYSAQTDVMMQAYVNQVSDGNKEMIENFFTVSNETQQQYVKSVLSDFNEFYQKQRNYDLQVIQTSMDMMQNSYDVQQLEQSTLLANLYGMVDTQSK